MISTQEMDLARECLQSALEGGASAVRITLTKSTEDIVATLDGKVDKVSRCADRSMNIAIFADGRFGAFSINKLEPSTLKDFILRAIETVKMLAPDGFRRLPDPSRYCRSALSGDELQIFDSQAAGFTPSERVKHALEAATFCKYSSEPLPRSLTGGAEGLRLISEEGEYSNSEYDLYVVDSQGLRCRHTETSFDYGVEITLQDADGEKYSDYWWTSSPFLKDFDPSDCGLTAIRRAASQCGSRPAASGRYNMVVGTEVASRLVTPLLNALNAYSIQQGNSFLKDSKGKQLFSDGLTILDEPRRPGETGSKLFDGEGVATRNEEVIAGGTVRRYSVNTYMSGKLQMEPTVEDVIRARVAPWPQPGYDKASLMKLCGSGILVTDFNGGNCNMTTGDFSYGISGQLFENGVPVRPVSEMLVTGNFLSLWKNLLATGSDARRCSSKLVPSLAFKDVDFSG